LEDPPADPPPIRPPAFLSRFRPAPVYTTGPLTGYCTACGALHFGHTDGRFEACCKKGNVVLPLIRKPPLYLSYLFTGDDPLCRAFRTNIRAYNCAFAFTSVKYKKDIRIDFSRGIQCFQIHSELFHFQGPLQPAPHTKPSFIQLFFYDPLFATNIRATNFPYLDRTVLLQLTDILTDCNPFITVYKTARKYLASQQTDFRVLFNPQMHLILESDADRCCENLPTSNEVTALIPDEYTDTSRRNLVLTVRKAGRKRPQIHTVNVIYVVYIPLYYVLLFPYGDPGWYYELQL
jgi:hypothetical protein